MKKKMIIFDGYRLQKGNDDWEKTTATILVDHIDSCIFVDNSKSHICFSCDYCENSKCILDTDDASDLWHQCKLCRTEDESAMELDSYVEIVTATETYRTLHRTLVSSPRYSSEKEIEYDDSWISLCKSLVKAVNRRESFDAIEAEKEYLSKKEEIRKAEKKRKKKSSKSKRVNHGSVNSNFVLSAEHASLLRMVLARLDFFARIPYQRSHVSELMIRNMHMTIYILKSRNLFNLQEVSILIAQKGSVVLWR